LETQRQTKIGEIQSTAKSLFNFSLEEIDGLRIKTEKTSLVFEKRDTLSESQQWQMKQPETQPANTAAISFLTDLLVNNKPERSFPLSLEQLADYGLDQPIATIEVQLKNHQIHELKLGKPDLEGRSLYAQVDNLPLVYIVPIEFQYAVDRELKEWKESP